MIGVIDYGAGNLFSIAHSLETVGGQIEICSNPNELGKYQKLVLPGVGAFSWCLSNLKSKQWIPALEEHALKKKTPLLGVCVGMQLLAELGFEGGNHHGLGWISGEVRSLPNEAGIKVPHIGWNSVSVTGDHALMRGIRNGSDFYFVHSYCFQKTVPAEIIGTCEHGVVFPAIVGRDNIVGTQFHPEKSQDAGLHLLQNFLHWQPKC